MAATTNLLSWEEFEQLPDDGMHHELIEGELQTLPPPKLGHTNVSKRMFMALVPAEGSAGGEAYTEAGYELSSDPASWVQPDVSFVCKDRIASTPDGYLLGAPDLSVEVVSPSETARDMERKIELLLASGGKAVWVIYPETRKAHVHLPDETSYSRGIRETLFAPEILPDWEMPVAELFED